MSERHTLRISCLAILLRQRLLLHHHEAKTPSGRLLPSLEKALSRLGNDFRMEIPPHGLDSVAVEEARRVALQITLPAIPSSNAQGTVWISIMGLFSQGHSADLSATLMPTGIQLNCLAGTPLSVDQLYPIFGALLEPETLIGRLILPASEQAKTQTASKTSPLHLHARGPKAKCRVA